MKIKKVRFLKSLTIISLLVFFQLYFLAQTPVARATDAYEECRQILTQDIFNKVITSNASSSNSQAVAVATFFQSSDTEAYEGYKRAFEEAKKNRKKIDAEGHYGVIGGQLGIDLTSENLVSESQFREAFSRAKSRYQSTTSALSSSNQNLASTYASYVRDPGTVNAWKECVTKTRETNIYTFASRDAANKIYVNVVWAPGLLGGSAPSITVDFVTDNDVEGVKVNASPQEVVAIGTGRSFSVNCGQKCDNGFLITVNGTIKDPTGRPTSSFQSGVEVPPLKPPTLPSKYVFTSYGVDDQMYCTLNGESIASQVFGNQPVEVDVTHLVNEGQKNDLHCQVMDNNHGKCYAWDFGLKRDGTSLLKKQFSCCNQLCQKSGDEVLNESFYF